MRNAIVAVSLAALVFAAGCNTEEKRLQGELTLANSRIAELEQSMNQTSAKADSVSRSLATVEQNAQRIRDSLEQSKLSLNDAVVKAQRTEARLQTERNLHRRSVDSLNQVRANLETTVAEREATIGGLESQLTMTTDERDRLQGQKDSLMAFVDDLRPWYEYYKKDSGRNWAKKLFGAGRAKKPTTPEPTFAPRVEPDLEAQKP
jgi:chromosome segregation ATPase